MAEPAPPGSSLESPPESEWADLGTSAPPAPAPAPEPEPAPEPRPPLSLRLRRLLLRARDYVFARTGLVGTLLAAALALLIWPGLGLRSPVYPVGEIAPRTVRAIRDFTYEDAAATEERRREAVELVPDVYDFDPQAQELVRARLAAAFSFGREAILSETIAEPAFRGAFVRLLETDLPPADLDLLERLAFSPEVEQSLADAVGSVLARDLLEEKSPIAALGRPIQRHDPQSGAARVVSDFSNILSLEEAREAASLQVLALSELGAGPRRALAALSAAFIRPTLERNEVETTRLRSEAAQAVETVVLRVRRGRTIIRAGDEVTPLTHRQMLELRATAPTASGWVGFGAAVFAAVVIWLLRALLPPSRPGARWLAHAFALAGSILVFHLAVARLLGFFARALSAQVAQEPFSDPTALVWAAPFASVALVVFLLESAAAALLTTALFAASLTMMTGHPTLGLFALLTGCAAVFFHQRAERPVRLLRVGALVGLSGVAVVAALEVVRGGAFGGFPRLGVEAGAALFGALLSVALVQLVLPVAESVFERTSDLRLMELARRDSPVLRSLAVSAPATYQHSVLVGILAESAADAIGANPALCATAALYHDIGKLNRVQYFVENNRGDASPHDDLPPEVSADLIRRHVTEGIEDARRLKLPADIVDVIPQHHGTRLIRFFYEKAKRQSEATGEPPDEAAFRYAGPKPQTREAGIIMMADSVEAAARSLESPGPAELAAVIDRIVESLVEDDQLTESGLTLGDMRAIRTSFLSTLGGIHHGRVPYPGFDFSRPSAPPPEDSEIRGARAPEAAVPAAARP